MIGKRDARRGDAKATPFLDGKYPTAVICRGSVVSFTTFTITSIGDQTVTKRHPALTVTQTTMTTLTSTSTVYNPRPTVINTIFTTTTATSTSTVPTTYTATLTTTTTYACPTQTLYAGESRASPPRPYPSPLSFPSFPALPGVLEGEAREALTVC